MKRSFVSVKVKVGLFLYSRVGSSSSQRPGLLFSLVSWSTLWGELGSRGVTVLYERAAAEGGMVFMPSGRPHRSHLPDVNGAAVMGFTGMFCN